MANQYTLNNDFSAIAEPQGTLYNVGDSAIELADADTTPKGQGILLMTGERRTFTGTLYARSMDTAATLNVSDFTEAAGGGDDVADVRRPSTEYAVGALVDGAGLASGLVLRCTTAGTTSSAALDCSGYELGDTVTDGTVTWLVTKYVTLDEAGGISPRVSGTVDLGSASKAWRKLYAGRIDEGTYIPGAFNKKETFTSSGTFTAPVTGTYRITLQGGGGGGCGGGTYYSAHYSGGAGGQGGYLEFYEKLTAGVSYSYTVGAGGTGSAAGTSTTEAADSSAGGNTSISINGNTYAGNGGSAGTNGIHGLYGGHGGSAKINSTVVGYGAPGGNGMNQVSTNLTRGGVGGGLGGGNVVYVGRDGSSKYRTGEFGGGGAGGHYSSSEIAAGGTGGDGYIVFEWYDTNA